MIEGYIDQVGADGRVSGWARDQGDANTTLLVEGFIGQARVAATSADRHRPDLESAGLAHGRYGYELELSASVLSLARETGQDVTVAAGGHPIGSISMAATPDRLPAAASALLGSALGIAALQRQTASVHAPRRRGAPPPKAEALAPLFAPARNDARTATAPPQALSAFMDLTRLRLRVDGVYQPDRYAADVDGFYRWALQWYARPRKPLRTPLSQADIAYLNAPTHLGDASLPLSRATLQALADAGAPNLLSKVNDPNTYREIAFWWHEEAVRLGVEDCLVPQYYAASLRETLAGSRTLSFPLSNSMELHHRARPDLHPLKLTQSAGDRAALYIWMLLSSVEEPSLARYLPERGLAQLKEVRSGERLFDSLLRTAAPPGAPLISWDELSDLLLRRGFDLKNQSFRTLDAGGNRSHSAMLARPERDDVVDVQVIGPFRKASGLGQACRLAAELIKRSGLSYAFFDFDVENPAPDLDVDGLSPSLKPSRINLLELNADHVPLAFAYLPDVFEDAYNIAYAVWELDSPAPAHKLGLDLLDELWVPGRYGADIFAPHSSKPVVAVGMTYAEPPQLSREEARAFTTARFGFDPADFVFLSTFDAFSFIQRKNPLGLLEAFTRAFPDERDVRLLIKTHNRDFVRQPEQVKIWREVLRLVDADARITLINETLPHQETLKLKQGCDCYVSLHRSEGWGFGMIEAMSSGTPVVATAYSGNLEFCTPQTAFLVDYELVNARPDEYPYVQAGHRWAEPSVESAVAALRGVRSDSAARERKRAAALAYVQEHFGLEPVAARYGARLREILAARR